MTEVDNVNHPSHYADGWSNGAEVIDITENLNFNRGNAVKYIARAGKKDPEKLLEDLQKAEFYLKREIQLVTKRWDNPPTYQVVQHGEVYGVVEYPKVPKTPRVWDSLSDVPIVVEVTDADGDTWKHHFIDRWQCWDDGDIPSDYSDPERYGPFTEILSDG